MAVQRNKRYKFCQYVSLGDSYSFALR